MKKSIKYIILIIIFILVLPIGILVQISHKLLKTSQLFVFFSQMFALVPGLPGTFIRASFYKQTLKKCSLDLDIGFCSFISKIDSEIGKGVLITGHTQIGRVKIGDNAVIANYVSILSGRYQHNFTDPNKNILDDTDDTFSYLQIGQNSFIGDQCTIMADIGEYSIVGAASNVVKPIPPYVVAVGNPAKVVKKRIIEPQPEPKHETK